MKKWLLRGLFFIPAITITLIILWVFIYPNFALFEMPLLLWILWASFWVSGFLLSYKQYYGGVVALIIPVGDYIYSLSGFAGHRHVNTLPYIVSLSIFYIICGVIVYFCDRKENKQHNK